MKPVQWEITTRGRPLWKGIPAGVGAPLLIHSATQFCPLSPPPPQSRLSTRSSHSPSKTSKIDNLLLLRQWNNWRRVEIGVLGGGKKKKSPFHWNKKWTPNHPCVPATVRLIKHQREVLQERALVPTGHFSNIIDDRDRLIMSSNSAGRCTKHDNIMTFFFFF